jgi:hypothetical protein
MYISEPSRFLVPGDTEAAEDDGHYTVLFLLCVDYFATNCPSIRATSAMMETQSPALG